MKSFGIAVYLAHMGFPRSGEGHGILSREGEGLYSSINVPDDLNPWGTVISYAEVLRGVKKVAEGRQRSAGTSW